MENKKENNKTFPGEELVCVYICICVCVFSSCCWTAVLVVVEDQRGALRQWWPSIGCSFSVS